MPVIRVAALQLAFSLDEPRSERIARVVDHLSVLPECDLVVLPELWAVGYFAFDRYATEARSLTQDDALAAVSQVARDRGCHVLAGSILERDEHDTLRNTTVLFGSDGEVLHTYSKHHLFGYQSREVDLLTPGDEVKTATTSLGMLGVTTCYDVRFPELYRLLVDQGAEIVLIPSAWPAARIEQWRLLVRARALENQFFVVGCNSAGTQGETELGGHSLVAGPDGAVIAEADGGEQTLLAELDIERLRQVRAEYPFLASRRIPVGERV